MRKLFFSICILTLSELSIAGQGWVWLNEKLEQITPSIDTSIPESRVELYRRLNSLLLNQDPASVLETLKSSKFTNDIQLEVFKARAYEDLNQLSQAKKIYQTLTEQYPEIADLWNNLAVVQAKLGQITQARQSLKTALLVDPDSKIAKENLQALQTTP